MHSINHLTHVAIPFRVPKACTRDTEGVHERGIQRVANQSWTMILPFKTIQMYQKKIPNKNTKELNIHDNQNLR